MGKKKWPSIGGAGYLEKGKKAPLGGTDLVLDARRKNGEGGCKGING